jgi:hypothetical protein
MTLDAKATAFINANRDAAMVALRRDGTPHVTRIVAGLVNGALVSSGTRTRLRTKLLKRDPRCTLFFFETTPGAGRAFGGYLSVEATVTIHDGPEALRRSVEYFKTIMGTTADGKVTYGGNAMTEDEALEALERDERILYEFNVIRTYGVG